MTARHTLTSDTLPSRAMLKRQATWLQQQAKAAGEPIRHSTALEQVAHSHGFRDWNTLSARLQGLGADENHAPAVTGQQIGGTYLGHAVEGKVLAITAGERDGQTGPFWRITLHLDRPVDVVRSPLFSSWRQRITAWIGPDGRTVEATSNGEPHLQLWAWSTIELIN